MPVVSAAIVPRLKKIREEMEEKAAEAVAASASHEPQGLAFRSAEGWQKIEKLSAAIEPRLQKIREEMEAEARAETLRVEQSVAAKMKQRPGEGNGVSRSSPLAHTCVSLLLLASTAITSAACRPNIRRRASKQE